VNARADRRDGRLLQAGVLLGVAAAGVAISIAGRRARRTPQTGLVDWPTVLTIAEGRLRGAPGTLTPAQLAAADASYAAAMRKVAPALEAHLGAPLPGLVERAGVVDRATWARANVRALERLFSRFEGDVLARILPPDASASKAAIAAANRWITTRQIGLMLAFMGQRVLGQYDVVLLAAEEEEPARLLFVEENVRRVARTLGLDADAFRTWIALHEATHAFEFEAHPWLRPYLASRVEAQIDGFSREIKGLGRETVRDLAAALRTGRRRHWLESLLSEEQRGLFRETQAVMSLLEGFGDHVMDEVGREIVPGHATISERFHARRERRSPMERTILRITGLDLKMEQYRSGERFVAAIIERGGPEARLRLWEGPESLPREGEIEDPDLWIARVMSGEAARGVPREGAA
jgi:coenzyme F420 biosynthesis associated uncharacterized protein